MKCSICDSLAPKRVRTINRHLKAGKKTPLEIAHHYKLDYDALRAHQRNCLQQTTGEHEDLERTRRSLSALICRFQDEIAHGNHRQVPDEDGEGPDGRYIVNNMLAAMRELRETILAINKLRTSEEVYHDLEANIVSPMVLAVTAICVDECRRLRASIFDLTRDTPKLQPQVKEAVDEMLRRLADRMNTEILHDMPEKVRAIVDKKPKRRAAPPAAH